MTCRMQSLLIPFLLLFINAQAGPGRYSYAVNGRVIDEQGQPVAHASVVIVTDSNIPRNMIYGVETNSEGIFRLVETEANELTAIRRLYAVGPRPPNSYCPVLPPFDELPSLIGQAYIGRPISIQKNAEVNLGNVQVQARYGVVAVQLLNQAGSPLVTDARAWRRVWLRIRNAENAIVIEQTLSINAIEQAVNTVTSTVRVALPEGTWRIEASTDEEEGLWLTHEAPVKISRSQDSQQVTLQPPFP